MKASIPTLLRRTAAIIAATGSFCFISEAAAAPPIKFPGGSCTLARIIITPDGGLGIECETAAGVTPTITLGAPSSMTVNTVANFSINRSGDNGATSVAWSASGSATGCNAGATLSFTAGVNSLPFSVTPTAAGSCAVQLNMTASTAGALGSPSLASFTVGATPPPPPPPPPPPGPSVGCPTGFVPPSDMIEGSMIKSGAEKIFMTSGRVYTAVIPRTNPGRLSGEVKLGETTSSAQVLQSIEMSVSKCKGEIKTDGGNCYLKSRQGSWNTLMWVEASIPGLSDADGTSLGVCYAKHTDGPWYYNMRYTYSECYYGTCAYVLQWNDGTF